MYNISFSQAKGGVETYNYLNRGKEYAWIPVVHFQTRSKAYMEMRYNYEEMQTFSFLGGKTFTGGSDLLFSITPMAGFSVGKFTGVTFAANAEADWKKIYVSTQSQYSMATKKTMTNFFFNWSELNYYVLRNFFAGLSMQYTRQRNINQVHSGFVAGLDFKGVTIPFYVFNPFQQSRYFVLGFNYEYHLKK